MLQSAYKYLWNEEDKKPMPSISSKDINKNNTNNATSINNTNNENKELQKIEEKKTLSFVDLINLPENREKTLEINDVLGIWIIRNNGRILSRTHKLINHPSVESYYRCYINNNTRIMYLMTNGHIFTFCYIDDSEEICIRFNDMQWVKYSKYDYRWI